MNRDLTDYRKSYEKKTLEEKDLPNSPFELFSVWFKEVEEDNSLEEANAMTVTTLGLDGFPRARIVLLKEFNEKGFIFYTNYNSQKGKSIENNSKICLSFFWPNLERQVIIKGVASKVEDKKSASYFGSRPRGSQLGAWASNQSEVIEDREVLIKKLADLNGKYQDKTIPRPPFWGGFLVEPIEFEFWQGRANRLHDRIRFKLLNKSWSTERLAP